MLKGVTFSEGVKGQLANAQSIFDRMPDQPLYDKEETSPSYREGISYLNYGGRSRDPIQTKSSSHVALGHRKGPLKEGKTPSDTIELHMAGILKTPSRIALALEHQAKAVPPQQANELKITLLRQFKRPGPQRFTSVPPRRLEGVLMRPILGVDELGASNTSSNGIASQLSKAPNTRGKDEREFPHDQSNPPIRVEDCKHIMVESFRLGALDELETSSDDPQYIDSYSGAIDLAALIQKFHQNPRSEERPIREIVPSLPPMVLTEKESRKGIE
ncbi:hypothetical protein AMTR_s00081p00023480 [Amborella trichopoda]|uniref:Uncharacterized protein n=1 Tax=Amborella trichopoda TaxID=13333 RepID=W1PBR4_AMBTC|nr:hypothetical protein AMTR_s00081p00023480 [Amborella trichopoda]